jgi:large subunit ribosomal protein L33
MGEGERESFACPPLPFSPSLFWETVMREYVWLECTVCGAKNYRTEKETRGADRLELKKFCRKERKHTPHKESRKK